MKIAVIGNGNIGSEIKRQAESLGWEIDFIIEANGLYRDNQKFDEKENYHSHLNSIDTVFLAIPCFDDGTTAFNYIDTVTRAGIPIITCEKGAMSNFYNQLKDRSHLIGYSASVGGGTRMLSYMQNQKRQTQEIHAVVNGTLNYIFSEVAKGKSFDDAVKEAKEKGFTEPGANTPLEIINKEANGDVPMKAAILFNLSRLSDAVVKASDFNINEMTESELNQLVIDAKSRRYIVSITKEVDSDVIGGFTHKVGEWVIQVGFKSLNTEIYKEVSPDGVDNGILLINGKQGEFGRYKLFGPGAGPGPTAASMILDAMYLHN